MPPNQVVRPFGQPSNASSNISLGQSQSLGGSQNTSQQQSGGIASIVPEYTLSGILHFLQSEWRRFERERNEWEIERAEMRARVALLEGERRGMENAKTDLLKRIKMLEYALRQERNRALAAGTVATSSSSQSGGQQAPAETASAPTTTTTADSADNEPQRNVVVTTTNGASGGTIPSIAENTSSNSPFNPHARAQQHTRDPKNWAKSREYLKACLQEIDYLTANATLNPLQNRPGMPTKDLTEESMMGNQASLPDPNSVWWDDAYNNRVDSKVNVSSAPNGAGFYREVTGERNGPNGQIIRRPIAKSKPSSKPPVYSSQFAEASDQDRRAPRTQYRKSPIPSSATFPGGEDSATTNGDDLVGTRAGDSRLVGDERLFSQSNGDELRGPSLSNDPNPMDVSLDRSAPALGMTSSASEPEQIAKESINEDMGPVTVDEVDTSSVQLFDRG